MKPRIVFCLMLSAAAIAGVGLLTLTTSPPPTSSAAPLLPLFPSPSSPTTTVKLIFIHHSTGGQWLADIGEHDQAGGLGQALMANNYFVSATNYQWGPRTDPGDPDTAIGSRTDVPNWPEWFTGPNRDAIMNAVYAESGQNIGDFGNWSRLATDPGGPNEIVMFKSCFPNSNLYGNPNDAPLLSPNDEYTVANFKAVYNNILTYFAAHPEKLFIVVTAPPLAEGEYVAMDNSTPAAERAANARAFNNWLVNDWLSSNHYTRTNVAVFDYYNVLTSNGSPTRIDDTSVNTETHDYDLRPNGNHHYWDGSAITHTQTVSNNYSAYPYYSGGAEGYYDSHPTGAGQQKATAEFVPWLNVIYHRWKAGGAPCVALADVGVAGPTSGYTGTQYAFTAVVTPANASAITYTWTPAPDSGQGTVTARYTWQTVGTKTITVTAQNCGGSALDTHTIAIASRPVPSRFIYLPVVLRNHVSMPPTGNLIQPTDFTYLGAFRLPGGDDPPQTFAYGGNAMTFNPDHNTLFITGHDRLPYGDLPDGDQIAEVSIPTPVNSRNIADLPTASFVQNFQNPTAGYFTNMEEIPKIGLQYLNHPDTGPLIHIAWGQHLQPDNEPSHAWFSATLAEPNLQGVWFIGYQNLYSTNGYMFEIPADWAAAHTQGRPLATGRMRDGGQGGMGPALFAYRPWLDGGAAPISGAHISETVLLLYENSYTTEEITRCLDGYQHPDEWEGGAWITTPSGKSAVLFAGTKSNGAKYWYGYIHPDGPQYPCVDADVTDFVTCRLADGTPCPAGDMTGCCEAGTDCVSERGWWSTRFDAQFILYDPAQFAQVAAGTLESWQPQPYARVDIDEHLYLNPPEWDRVNVGWGDQRRYRIGDATYDRVNGRLYVLELYADGGKPVVHVWEVQ